MQSSMLSKSVTCRYMFAGRRKWVLLYMSAVQGVQTDRHSVTRDRDTTLAELVWNKPKRETKKNTHTLHTSKNKVHGNIAALLAPQ